MVGSLVSGGAVAILASLHDEDVRQRAAGVPVLAQNRSIDRESGRLLALAVVADVRRGDLIHVDNVVPYHCPAVQRPVRGRGGLDAVTLPLERGIERVMTLG